MDLLYGAFGVVAFGVLQVETADEIVDDFVKVG